MLNSWWRLLIYLTDRLNYPHFYQMIYVILSPNNGLYYKEQTVKQPAANVSYTDLSFYNMSAHKVAPNHNIAHHHRFLIDLLLVKRTIFDCILTKSVKYHITHCLFYLPHSDFFNFYKIQETKNGPYAYSQFS